MTKIGLGGSLEDSSIDSFIHCDWVSYFVVKREIALILKRQFPFLLYW